MGAPLAMVVHGGAGPAAPDDDPEAVKAGCLAAARLGYRVLQAGGRALDAVEAAVAFLEDHPLFNAGRGSALNLEGEVEMDASIMDGQSLGAGAVAAVRTMPNPVRLARAVLEHTPHVLLAGSGAERFGLEQGMATVDPASLITPRAQQRLAQRLAGASHGTVGAVALDPEGHLAAATSTGGTSGKRPGRVGDTPLIGCGTYADDLSAAASATGLGEAIIKVVLAKHACDAVATGMTPQEAARQAIGALARVEGQGGIILLDRRGRMGIAFSSMRMSRAFIDPAGNEGSGFGV